MRALQGLTRIEYIESTGTQRIDTGVDASHVYGLKFSLLDVGGVNGAYFMRTSNSFSSMNRVGTYACLSIKLNGVATNFWGRDFSLKQEIYTDNDMSTYHLKQGTQIVNATYTHPLSPNSENIIVACDSSARFFEVIFKDANNNIIFNGVPVKTRWGEGCLYDMVSGQLLHNMGSGEFVCGPEIV